MGNEQENRPQQDEKQLLKIRREKLDELRESGNDPYLITTFEQTHHAKEIRERFEELESTTVRIAGRLMSKRVMGKASFCNVKDASGQKINVAIAGISLQSKREALKDLRDSEDTAREVKAGRAREQAAREAKIGTPKPVAQGDSVSKKDEGPSAAPAAKQQPKGRLGTGVRHYSNDDE